LKSLISASTSANTTASFLDKSVDIQKQKQLMKQEAKDNAPKDQHMEDLHMKSNARIVKHIRGGSKFTNILKQGQTPSQSKGGHEEFESAEKAKDSDEKILAGLSESK